MVIIREEPLDAARLLADDLDADLAIGGTAASLALDRLWAEAAGPTVDLDALAAAMRRAEHVRERTRASTAQNVARSLNTDLAIHPETLHRAASELVQATAARQRAEQGRIEAGRATGLRRVVASGIVAAGVVLIVRGEPAIGGAVATLGAVSALVAFVATRRAARAGVPALRTDEEVARRRWEQLAGAGADPGEVEAVIHRYDPGQRLVTDLIDHHPAVRATERAARIHRNAWVAAWCEAVGDRIEVPTDDPIDQERRRDVVPATDAEQATLVLAAPYASLDDEEARRLHHRMLTLPDGPRVIVVLGPDAPTDRTPTLDLTGPNPTLDLTGADAAPVVQLKEEPQPQVR